MSALQDLQLQIRNGEAAIVAQFNVATERTPWNRLPAGERINYLRHLIRPLAQIAVGESSDPKVYLRAMHIAAHHGERRQYQGLPDSIVFEDLSFFRWAVCQQIPADAGTWYLEAIGRIDRLLTLASAAALRGYHREVFEARGEWPDVLEGLVAGEAGEGEGAGGAGVPARRVVAAAGGAGDWGEINRLAQSFVADARQWLHRLRVGAPGPHGLDDRLVLALLNEYAGALDLLEVLREELTSAPQGPVGADALVMDSSSSIQFANRAAVESLGYPAYELHGTALLDLVHPDDRGRMEELLRVEAGTGEAPARVRLRVRHPEGSWLTVAATMRPLLLGGETKRFLMRGRVAGVALGDSVEPGRKGEFFKRHVARPAGAGRRVERGEIEAREGVAEGHGGPALA